MKWNTEMDEELDKYYKIKNERLYSLTSIIEKHTDVIVCPFCGCQDGTIKIRRRNSEYQNDEENWLTSCTSCFDDDTNQLTELWNDYYSGCM
jgi:hypothetical protein